MGRDPGFTFHDANGEFIELQFEVGGALTLTYHWEEGDTSVVCMSVEEAEWLHSVLPQAIKLTTSY